MASLSCLIWYLLFASSQQEFFLEDLDKQKTFNKKVININGKNISYIDEGHGPPIVFVHGLGLSSDEFIYLIDSLKDDYRCIALDLPGYGHSEYVPLVDLSDYLDLLESFSGSIGVEKAHWIGHSFGGLIVSEMNIKKSHLVEKTVNIEGALFIKHNIFYKRFIEKLDDTKTLAFDTLLSSSRDDNTKRELMSQVSIARTEAIKDSMNAISSYDFSRRDHPLQRPYLFVGCKGEVIYTTSSIDTFFYSVLNLFVDLYPTNLQVERFDHAYRLSENNMGEIVIISGNSHFLIYDNPRALSQVIKDFLS